METDENLSEFLQLAPSKKRNVTMTTNSTKTSILFKWTCVSSYRGIYMNSRKHGCHKLVLHDATCITDYSVSTPDHCLNLKEKRYETESLNRILADKSQSVTLSIRS